MQPQGVIMQSRTSQQGTWRHYPKQKLALLTHPTSDRC